MDEFARALKEEMPGGHTFAKNPANEAGEEASQAME